MGAPNSGPQGKAITVAAAGAAVVIARDCTLLGFFASATQTLVLNDTATTGGVAAGNQVLNASACAVGWNPFPIFLNSGLVANPGTGNITFVVA